MNLTTLFLVLLSLSLSATAQVLLRKGMLAFTTSSILANLQQFASALVTSPWIWAGLACYGASVAPWLVVLSRLPVSVAYPLVSIGYVLTAAAAALFLGETLSATRVVGIALICLGVFVISRAA
jgi:multidrug transporter EmrE-like cation transporter